MDQQNTAKVRRSFLNRKRLLVYPRLFFIVLWSMVVINFALRDGWEGRITGIFGFDFLVFYSSGTLYWQNIDQFYDFDALATLEETYFAPNSLEGYYIPNSYPPYVALLTSAFTAIPIFPAFLIWTGLSLLAIVIASRWLAERLVPIKLRAAGLTSNQMLIILLSFFPTVFGLHNGQNHAFTLLLITGILVCTIERKPIPAGLMAGLLIYKPQFVLGFLVLWLVWKEYRALIAAAVVAAIWAGSVVLMYGIDPYIDYINNLPNLFLLPLGISKYVNTSISALFITLLPDNLAPTITSLSLLLMIAGLGILAWLAYRFRRASQEFRYALLILAGLFPFIAAPHVLMYDLIALAPLFVLWSHLTSSRILLYAAISVYLGAIILPSFSHWLGVALMGLFPLGMLVGLLVWFRRRSAALQPASLV